MMIRTLCTLFLVSAVSAWTMPTLSTGPSIGRRDVMSTIAASAAFLAAPDIANAMEAVCSNDKCVRATWTPPSGTTKEDAILSVRGVLMAVPKDTIDGGGWTLVNDELDSKGTAYLEFKSTKGKSAKKEDLFVKVKDSGIVELLSSSKGVKFLTKEIEAMGWDTA